MSDNERLAVIETEVKNISKMIEDHSADTKANHAELKKTLKEHDTRLRGVERFRNIAIGAAAVVTTGTGAFWKYLTGN